MLCNLNNTNSIPSNRIPSRLFTHSFAHWIALLEKQRPQLVVFYLVFVQMGMKQMTVVRWPIVIDFLNRFVKLHPAHIGLHSIWLSCIAISIWLPTAKQSLLPLTSPSYSLLCLSSRLPFCVLYFAYHITFNSNRVSFQWRLAMTIDYTMYNYYATTRN